MSYTPAYECDLHCHTLRSDGSSTPRELIDKASKLRMKAVAITDHDINPPQKIEVEGRIVNIIDYAKQKGITLVLGYEFSTDTYVDDVHIIGFNMDWSHSLVQKAVREAKESKSQAYRSLCEILTEEGMPIDFDNEILRYRDENGVERLRKPEEVERKFIFEKMADKGYTESWEEAKLFVRDNPRLNVRRPKIDPLETIELIHETGGIAVLAHPYLIDTSVTPEKTGPMTREEYIERLINHGLDAIEARYTYDKTSYKGSKTVFEIEREVRKRYEDRLHISGGSDYHGGEKKGIENPRMIGEAGIDSDEFEQLFGKCIEGRKL